MTDMTPLRMHARMAHTGAFSLAVMLLLNACAFETPRTPTWPERLAETSARLRKRSYESALTALGKLSEQMVEELEPGEDAARLLTALLTQRAIAEHGLGHDDEALWHWFVAQNLDPKSATTVLSSFGAEGEFLKNDVLPRPLPERCPEPSVGISPPVVKKARTLKFPEATRLARAQGLFVVQLTIDSRGRPSAPRIIKHLPVTLEYAALEVMRTWEFEPARKAGVAVAAEYCAAVNFRLTQ